MGGFLLRLGSLAVLVCVLAGYNLVLENRERDEKLSMLQAQVEALEQAGTLGQTGALEQADAGKTETSGIQAADSSRYQDGEWEGEGQGFGGPICLKVKVEEGKLTDIQILSAEQEDKAYFSMAEEGMLPAILEAQSADVDTISGATFSSGGIRDAVGQALEKAEG